jgi:hypothetical protein
VAISYRALRPEEFDWIGRPRRLRGQRSIADGAALAITVG